MHKLHAADDAWERARVVAGQELSQGRVVSDVFVIQKIVTQRMKDIVDDEFYDAPPPIPAIHPEEHRVFATERAHPPRMWSTHPPNRAREDNAKEIYVAAPIDARPAWDLFTQPAELRSRMTEHLLKRNPDAAELPKVALTDTVASVNKQYTKVTYQRRYRGVYMGRSVVRDADSVTDLFADELISGDVRAGFAAIYPAELTARIEYWRNLEEERDTLQAIYDGTLASPDGVIRHRGTILKRKQLPVAINELEVECNIARRELQDHDRLVRSVHRAAATEIGNGWPEYHFGIVSLLHYADHTEANLIDARKCLNSRWSVVIADGKISASELRDLLVVAQDLYAVMLAIEAQKGEVRLCNHVTAEMGVSDWRKMLHEDFGLVEPTAENLGDWLEVLDGWLDYFQEGIAALRRESLEALLGVETLLERGIFTRHAIGIAPEPAAVPADYALLLPLSGRQLQKKMGLWDRFQIADGLLPGLARFAVATTIVGGLLGLGMWTGGAATVTIYNGLVTPVVVSAAGEQVAVGPLQSAEFSPPADAQLSVQARTAAGEVIETIVVDASNSLADYVYNVAAAAPMVEWTAVYGATAERAPRFLGMPVWFRTDADLLFREPPDEVHSAGSGGSRDVLDGFGNFDPQFIGEYLPDGVSTAAIVRTHASWDNAQSSNFLSWLVLASSQEDFSQVLATRLARYPGEVISLRFEQDTAANLEHVCARHRAAAELVPADIDWRYLAIRCMTADESQSEAFLQAFAAAPAHPWLAGAAGYVFAERGEWAQSAAAFDVAFNGLRAMRPSYADTLARVRRMQHGVQAADVSDIATSAAWVGVLSSLETGLEVAEPSLQSYQHLARGELELAVERANASNNYADGVLRLAAASDGASTDLIARASALGVEDGLDDDPVWVALGFASRHNQPTADLLARIEAIIPAEAPRAREMLAVVNSGRMDTVAVEDILYGATPDVRGKAYAMGVVALGDNAPEEWLAIVANQIEQGDLGRELRELGYVAETELITFARFFLELVKRSRMPKEIVAEQKLDSLQKQMQKTHKMHNTILIKLL